MDWTRDCSEIDRLVDRLRKDQRALVVLIEEASTRIEAYKLQITEDAAEIEQLRADTLRFAP